MLVLSRKIDQEISVGGIVKIKVLGIHGRRVSLGITAPKNVSIERDDVKHKPNASKTSERRSSI